MSERYPGSSSQIACLYFNKMFFFLQNICSLKKLASSLLDSRDKWGGGAKSHLRVDLLRLSIYALIMYTMFI